MEITENTYIMVNTKTIKDIRSIYDIETILCQPCFRISAYTRILRRPRRRSPPLLTSPYLYTVSAFANDVFLLLPSRLACPRPESRRASCRACRL